jgi:hypothetical protein
MKLEKFNISNIFNDNKSKSIIIYGSENGGKSSIVDYLLNKEPRFKSGIIIARDDELEQYYSKYNKHYKLLNAEELDLTILKNVINNQISVILNSYNNTHFVIVFDSYFKYMTDINCIDILRDLFFNYFIYNITIIVTLNYPVILAPSIFNYFDYTFILESYGLKERIKLYNYYEKSIMSFDQFNELNKKYINKYNMLVIDNIMKKNYHFNIHN